MKHEAAITLSHISKRYILHHEKPTFVENVLRPAREEFWALRDISLTIPKGQNVGIIGKNGSGKTTLLKIIAGITTPSEGHVQTHGKIVSLIELTAGFHADLTGEENIVLNGMLLGMRRSEIAAKRNAIVRFAGIGRFIDAPLYTYSAGMTLRLGFAVAVHADPDILILDEGLSVGDKDFQKKSQDKIREFFRKGKTVLVVTHMLEFVRRNCNRVILLDGGHVVADGTTAVLTRYEQPTKRG